MNNIKEVLKKAADKINIDNFLEMYNCLKEINDKEKQKKYKDDFKDLIQLIIDYLIFGDKKKEQIYFDNFCELDFMKEFIVASKSRNMDILLQIIKSLSALILTVTNQTSLFYIFSNNFINNIITNDDIQESSEDFLSFYVNFLKSLSLKIDVNTIQLFFQKEKNNFPLLENALKLYNNDDSMIKNVVRNIFLKFAGLSKEYEPLKDYLMSLPILKYYCFLSCRLTDMTKEINHLAGYNILYNFNLSSEYNFNYDKLKGLQDDLIDEILYLNDILSINDSQISFALLNTLLYYYICPLLLGSLYNYKFIFYKNQNKNKYVKFLIAPEIALYILTLFFSNIHNDSLLNILCCLLFKQRINEDVIEKFVNVQFNKKSPIYPANYSYTYKENNYKEKNMSFLQYITYNYNEKFICSLILKHKTKYQEVTQLLQKYEKKFEDSSFDPYNNYENIFNDINSKFYKNEKEFMRNYHNLISVATGIKIGLSEDEYRNNVLNYLNNTTNMILNPIRIILLENLFKCGFEIVNFGVNVLLYSMFYSIMIDENNNMNKSLSRKFLYYECNLLPYELFITKNVINRNIAKKEINEEEDINNIKKEKENNNEKEDNNNIINEKKKEDNNEENTNIKNEKENNNKEADNNNIINEIKKEDNKEDINNKKKEKENIDDENIAVDKKEKPEEEKEDNIIVTNDDKKKEKNEHEENEIKKDNNFIEDKKELEKKLTTLLLFKTENYELKYKDKTNIYTEDFNIDNNTIDNLINLMKYSRPYCSLEFLLFIYNIKFLSCSTHKKEDLKLNDTKHIISKDLIFTKEQELKLIDIFILIIQRIKAFLLNNRSYKYISFELLENVWKSYQKDYSFNIKNLIIKYILTPYYICIPSVVLNVDDFPFKSNNSKYSFETLLIGYLALKDVFNNKKSEIFPLENGNYEYKIGDKINFENINIHSSKYKIIKLLVKKYNKNEFEENTIFVNKNCIIFGIEEKNEDKSLNNIIIKSMHPLRELEICLDNSFTNSLQIYFKTNNYIIQCESNEKRKQIKADLEMKRNEFRKWEQDNLLKLLNEDEKKYKELNEKNKFDFYLGGKKNEGKEEDKEKLFNWD